MSETNTDGPFTAPPETIEARHWRQEYERAMELVRTLDQSSERLATERDEALAEVSRLRGLLREACEIASDAQARKLSFDEVVAFKARIASLRKEAADE